MTRTPTTTDTTVEWEERVTDPDSDTLTLSLVLDAVDDGSGFTNNGTDSSNLSWLSYGKTNNQLADGTTEVLVNIVADKSGLDQGYSYRFKITADDGTTAVDRTFTLSIENPPRFSGERYFIGQNDQIKYLNAPNPFETKSDEDAFDSESTLPNTPTIDDIFIRSDGKKLFVVGAAEINEYDLGTAWDTSTATHVTTLNFDTSNFPAAYGAYYSTDGTKIISVGNSLWESNLSTAWSISTISTPVNSNGLNGITTISLAGISMKPDGTYGIVVTENEFEIYEFELTTPWDVSTLNWTHTKSADSFSGVYLGLDGKSFWATYGGQTFKYNMSTAYDLSTADNGTLVQTTSFNYTHLFWGSKQ